MGSSAGGTAYTWIGNTSRDEYLGAFFGLCVAFDMIDDAPTRAQVARLVSRLLDNLLHHVWTVVMPDLSVSTTFVARPDQQLTMLQIGRHANSKYNAAYSSPAVLAPSVLAPISIDCADTHGSYFKFNLDYISFYHLIGLETSSIRKFFYTEAYGILRKCDRHAFERAFRRNLPIHSRAEYGQGLRYAKLPRSVADAAAARSFCRSHRRLSFLWIVRHRGV